MRRALLAIGALWVASARTVASYPVGQVVAIVGLAVAVVPLFLVGTGLQPFMQGIVASEGGAYFPFLLVGNALLMLVVGTLGAPASAVGGAVGSGSLEAMLATASSPAALVLGLSAYPVTWATVRTLVLLVAGAMLGIRYHLGGLGIAVGFALLVAMVYYGIGLVEAAVVVAFRAGTPLPKAALLLSVLLGGVYYPPSSAPQWLQGLASVTPLGYGLRGIRRVLLAGDPASTVLGDLLMLGCMAFTALALGTVALGLAMDRARRLGTLGSF